MLVVIAVLQALQILAPLVEELVVAFTKGQAPDFVSTLPEPLRSRVALNVRQALHK